MKDSCQVIGGYAGNHSVVSIYEDFQMDEKLLFKRETSKPRLFQYYENGLGSNADLAVVPFLYHSYSVQLPYVIWYIICIRICFVLFCLVLFWLYFNYWQIHVILLLTSLSLVNW